MHDAKEKEQEELKVDGALISNLFCLLVIYFIYFPHLFTFIYREIQDSLVQFTCEIPK